VEGGKDVKKKKKKKKKNTKNKKTKHHLTFLIFFFFGSLFGFNCFVWKGKVGGGSGIGVRWGTWVREWVGGGGELGRGGGGGGREEGRWRGGRGDRRV